MPVRPDGVVRSPRGCRRRGRQRPANSRMDRSIQTARLSLRSGLKSLYARRETIRFLVSSNLQAGHRDKVLGHLWSLLDPLFFAAVYFVVFGLMFGQTRRGQGSDFLVYLVIGVFAWRFMDGSIMQAASCIRGRRGLIHEINFPKAVFPVSICLSRLYDFLWGQVALVIILLFTGTALSLHALWVPSVILLQLLFITGMAFIVAYLGAFFADTVNVVTVGLRLWFYTSPLFYYVKTIVGPDGHVIQQGLIPERFQALFMLNPVACFFEIYRDCLQRASPPDFTHFAYVTCISIAVLVVGFAVFLRGEGSFAKYV